MMYNFNEGRLGIRARMIEELSSQMFKNEIVAFLTPQIS